ncbi:MAG TPA: ShlB/FhaC/HecB family hemolysin secretion/activation protein [Abditibacteriaceae bacterium]|jgi:hemolysin activation/secretion protein
MTAFLSKSCLSALLFCAFSVCGPHAQEAAPAKAEEQLSTAARIGVRAFRFEGNTVFSSAQLGEVVREYADREVSSDELEEARRKLSQFYVDRGYVNSGALLRDQSIRDGIITWSIVEGKLTGVQINGRRRFRSTFLQSQIAPDTEKPLNVLTLRDRLQLLRQNPNIKSINADVRPGLRPGEATLQVELVENKPDSFSLEFDNHRAPSVGAERVRLVYNNRNLLGLDDSLTLRTGLTRDDLDFANPARLGDFAASYQSPAFGRDTRLVASYSKGDSAVIEEPFRALGISSESENYALGLRQPLRRTLNEDVSVSATLEHRKSESFLFGLPFSFSLGDVNGVSETTAIRFGVESLQRGQSSVLASRALLSYGNNFPGSTRNAVAPGGKFMTLLGQVQHVRVLDEKGRQLVLRLDGQWADKPLLSVEKFSIGGASSVRGYRENQLVRDKGFAASAEVRVPLLRNKLGAERLTLAPFFDFGAGKNKGAVATAGQSTLSSLGVGLLYTDNRLNAQVYYGHALKSINTADNDLQDKGIHFGLSFRL